MGTGNNEGSTMFPTLRIERVLELPQVLSANTLYLVKPDTSNEMTLVATGFTAEIIGQTNSTVEAVLAQLGTSAQYDVSINGDALIDQVVLGSDSRLSDARPPLSHSHTAGELIAILGSANASDLGVSSQAGISELAAREDHVHKRPTATEVGAIPASEIGQSVAPVVNGKVPSQFLPESEASTLGTAASKDVAVTGDASTTEVVMGNDSRLTDAREPVSHTHIYYELADLISWESNPRPLGTPTWGVVPWASRADHVHPLPSLATLGAQAENVILNALSSVIVNTADRLIYSTGANEFNTTPLSYFARVLLGAVDEANARTVLGLNSSATLAADTDGTLSANSDTRLATQKAVKTYVDSLVGANDAMVFKGVIDASTNPNYPAANTGYTYRISVGGKIGGVNGPVVENGDIIICQADNVISGNHATVGTNWCIIQVNLDGALTLSNIGTTVQAFDTTLAALAGVPTAADKLIYANGVDSFLTTDFTAFARTILASPDAAALRSALGLGTASTKNVPVSGAASATEVVLGNDPRLSDSRTPLSHSHTAGELIGLLGSTAGTALGTASSGSANTAARSDHVHPVPTLGTLGAQPADATLTALAGVTTSANQLIYAIGPDNFATSTLTTFARSLLDDADASAARTTLGLGSAATLTADTDGTLAANSDTSVATQKAVKTYVDNLISANDAMVYKGAIDASTNPNYPAASAGHTYRISVAGKIGGASGVNVEVGDIAICYVDGTASGTQATVGNNWNIIQVNIDGVLNTGSIGTTVQAYDATLTGLAGVTTAADKLIYATGVDTFATTTLTTFARSILDDTDALTARTTLGLGTAATKDVAASGNASTTQVVMGNDSRLTDARTPLAHNHDGSYEPVVTAGTTTQYYRGDKTFQDLGTAVRGSAMTGMSTTDSTAVSVTDTLLTAVGKLQAQVNGKQATLTSGTNIKTVNGVSLLGSGNINTGDVSSTSTNTFQQQQTFNAAVVEKHIDLGTGVNFDLALANSFSKTMTVAQTFTVSNVPASGNSVAVILNLTNGGNFTPTFWANVKWPGGTVPTFTTNGKDVIGLYTYDGGATWTGLILGKDVK